jgi:hypothetical protein
MSNPALAQRLLALQVVGLALIFWYFYPLVRALIAFTNPDDSASLMELRPNNGAEAHNPFRYLLSAEVFISSASWFWLLRRSGKQSFGVVPSGRAIAGGAVLLLTLFSFALPFVPLHQANFQRVRYGSATCYWIAEQASEVLLFCPLRFPRQLTVPADDAMLVKTGTIENIFKVFDGK